MHGNGPFCAETARFFTIKNLTMKLKLLLAALILPFIALAQQPDTVGVAARVDSLIKESRKCLGKRDFANALVINEAAEQLSLEKKGKISVEFGRACYNRGAIQLMKVEYGEAEESLLLAKSILSQYLDKASLEYSRALVLLGQLYADLGRLLDSERNLLEARDLREKLYGNKHPEYAKVMHRLGIVYYEMGAYEKSEESLLIAKSIREKSPGKESPDYTMTLNELANVYNQGQGEYEKAESTYLEVLATQEKILGKENLDYANTLSNLGTLYVITGNYPQAIKVHLEARDIRERVLGKEHQQYTASLHNLADAYHLSGQYQQALKLALEAKEIRGRTLGIEHPVYASTLHNLGTIYMDMGQYKEAEQLFLEAMGIREQKLGKDHILYAGVLKYLGLLYQQENRLQESEEILLEAKEKIANKLGTNHIQYIQCIHGLFKTYWHKKQYDEALTYLKEMEAAEMKLMLSSLRYLSEREIEAFKQKFSNSISESFSYIQIQPDISPLCYDNILFYKGYTQNALTRVSQVSQNNPSIATTYQAYKGYLKKLATEYSKPIAERKNVAEIEEKANTLEKELTRSVAGYGDAIRQVCWQEVQAALKPGQAAIEYVDYSYLDPKPTDSVMYAALVLKSGDVQPQFIPLFEKNELLPHLRGATGGNNFLKINALYTSKPSASGQKSPYELIWKPLEEALKNISTVYCASSGLLHYLNLAAIPVPDGKPFGETRDIVLLGSTRSLAIDPKAGRLAIPNAGEQNSPSDAYLAGGIRYEGDSIMLSLANQNIAMRSTDHSGAPTFRPDSSATRAGDINYLPATATEVREIGQMLRAANFSTKVDTGFYASEEAFRSLGVGKPSPRILHLATHGYFFPDPKGKKSKDDGQESVFKMSEHPMIRSGLIMAGAKQAWLTGNHPEGQEDGILTAYEISQMNLSSTELVVLSACETGLGQVSGNEGVYGLQRAFKIAGVKYLIMSLWKVDDRSTKAFMAEFYKQWLQGKQSIPQAFRAAQQAMRTKNPSPYDWAGFVLIE